MTNDQAVLDRASAILNELAKPTFVYRMNLNNPRPGSREIAAAKEIVAIVDGGPRAPQPSPSELIERRRRGYRSRRG